MLLTARSLKDLNFGKLMDVYLEGNRENGNDRYPDAPEQQRLLLAEQDFYQYLRECFFPTPGAVYYIWAEGERYVSALRLEPYRDGLLLEALETAPEYRKKGFAFELVQSVLQQRNEKIYSHISKKNIPSLRTHQKCGFRRILDYAVYADGSVSQKSYTFCK